MGNKDKCRELNSRLKEHHSLEREMKEMEIETKLFPGHPSGLPGDQNR
jgi:hypothetical protein